MAHRLLLLLAFLGLSALAAPASAATVVLVLSEPTQAYQEFADAFRNELRRAAPEHDVQVIDSDQLGARPLMEAPLVVAVGSRAAQLLSLRELRGPLLMALLPRSTFERATAGRAAEKRISAVFVDQPPSRYVDLVRVALPDMDRIGMLAGRDSGETVSRLVQTARERKLKPQQETISSEFDIVPALQRMFTDGNGALLATPDGSVFNSNTIPNILLSAYRLRVPVIGFSQSYVKAGAMLAIYSTPAQIGAQSADIARTTLAGGALPPPQYPRHFLVGVNPHVARSLGFQLDSEASIKEKLERLERTP